MSDAPSAETSTTRDHGCLPDWQTQDLPEPLPFSIPNALKMIGPGAILLAGSIGGGEWIVGPMMTVKYGRGILWLATVAIFLQMMFNLEGIRYTLYTGEPILTGIMRLRPGSKLWGGFYIFIGIAQLATPALALGSANVIFASMNRRMPANDGSDASILFWLATVVIGVTVVLLLSGRSIERVLERISWVMVGLIFVFLAIVNIVFVSIGDWMQTIAAFFVPSALPDEMDFTMLALFTATAGSGGIGNLVISNWVRDKGFGMGALTGGIGGVLAEDHIETAAVGSVFPITESNLARWKHWWKYVMADQAALWALGCLIGMFLNVNIAAAIIPSGTELSGNEAGVFQADFMARSLWDGFWSLCLLNGFWVMFSTHIGNTDGLTRTISDISWAAWPKVQRRSSSRLYAIVLMTIVIWGIVALRLGDNALSLFKILGIVAGPILAIAAVQILRVNTRFLPPELRPGLFRRAMLVVCGVFYGTLSLIVVGHQISSLLGGD